MVTDTKLGESSGEVYRIVREQVAMDTEQKAIDLRIVSILKVFASKVTHQKCDISILEEVLAMLYKRVIALPARGTRCLALTRPHRQNARMSGSRPNKTNHRCLRGKWWFLVWV